MGSYRFFLGGRDLEMIEIADVLRRAGFGDRVVDSGLAWGAHLAQVIDAVRVSLAQGETPVLIEIADDGSLEIDRSRIVLVDHHGSRAGRHAPSALRQVFDLVAADRGLVWDRRLALVEANDIGHAAALRAAGATADEIRRIRDEDRAAQGVTPEVEAESRRAIKSARRVGRLTVIETTAPTSSAITDFLLPEYGGDDPHALLVVMPEKVAFFGPGAVIASLSKLKGSWFGGDLPDRGYWGSPRSPETLYLENEIARML